MHNICGVSPIGLNRLNKQASDRLRALFDQEHTEYTKDIIADTTNLLIAIDFAAKNFEFLSQDLQEKILFENLTEEDIYACISQLTT